MKIKDILSIDLSEDIKSVIDIQQFSETEIIQEIDNYIITDGLAREYSKFVSTFTSNILETGVWISGFYGSGKSYFGKLLGYLLNNRMLAGTPARDRILQRFTGIDDEALIINNIRSLNAYNCRVVFLDVAKQDTTKGLAYTLYNSFLSTLDIPANDYGIFLYQLMVNANIMNVYEFVDRRLGLNWEEIRHDFIQYTKTIKEIYIKEGNSETDYNNLLTSIRRDIDQFSSTRLSEELSKYLQIVKDERVVFIFDEASEAIGQKKFTLLDLEGVSESLTSLGNKVWTIAIAQQRLDEVISNSGLNKAQLTKVTDRFKTKIHLESTEVDIIIKNRLLKKTDEGLKALSDNYDNHSGAIAEHAALIGAGVSKTDSLETYSTYYPFYKSQFDLLQNFLFGKKGLTSTKVANRGMIITTYDILKNTLQNNDLFHVAAGWQIASHADNNVDVRLSNKYENAERILREEGLNISGRKLLETINFLYVAEMVPTTLPNIVKSYSTDPEQYHNYQGDIEEALDILTEAKVLLDTNKMYRITSDIEQRLLDEMKGYTVQQFVKKNRAVKAYKSSSFVSQLSRVNDNGLQYSFYITTENDDELTSPPMKQLKIKIKTLYSFDDRSTEVENLKMQHQNDKDLMWIVPDNKDFRELDKLIDEGERIGYLEERYTDPNSEEGRIMLNFLASKAEKENRINKLIDEALINSIAVYLYNTFQLNDENWQTTLQAQQRQIIQNVFYKRLSSQLDEKVALSVVRETNNAKLRNYFNGPDFQFFDAHGNFVGNNLVVVEEIINKIRNTFVDGATIEKELEMPPTGYTFGTVSSTMAALLRAGRVIAKYNGNNIFSWRDPGVQSIFGAAREFRKASFKEVSKTLSTLEKQELAQCLLDIEVEKYINRKVNYNTNDFELMNAVRDLAKHFTDKVKLLKDMEKEFDKLFPDMEEKREFLLNYTGAISENNYIDRANDFLSNKTVFVDHIRAIEKVEKFIKNNLPKVKGWKLFVSDVAEELNKAAQTNDTIAQHTSVFDNLYSQNIVGNFASLQQTTQKIKDEYHSLFSKSVDELSKKYIQLKADVEALISEINLLPEGLNTQALQKANALHQYASQRANTTVSLDFDVKDKNSLFTYSEVLSFIELYSSKSIEVDIIRAGLVREAPTKTEIPTIGGVAEMPISAPKVFNSKLPGRKVKVSVYKHWLQKELQKLASLSDNDEIEIN
jgi:hypothetical protein